MVLGEGIKINQIKSQREVIRVIQKVRIRKKPYGKNPHKKRERFRRGRKRVFNRNRRR